MRVAPEALPRATNQAGYVRVEAVGPVDDEGWTTLSLRADIEEEAWGYVFSFGTRMEVLDPLELRERMARLAADVAGLYRHTTP